MKIGIFAISFSLLMHAFSSYGASIVLLQGPSSVGKSSICNEIIRLDTSWKMVEEDMIVFENNRQLWNNLFPQEYAIIERSIPIQGIYPAVLRNKFFFKEGVQQKDKDQALHAIAIVQRGMRKKIAENPTLPVELKRQIRQQIVKNITNLVLQGSNVIVDSWVLEKEDYEALQKTSPIMHGLVYCPLPEIMNRVIKRNSDSILKNNYDSIRIFRNPLYSFLIYYDASKDPTLPIVDKLSRDTVSKVIENVQKNMIPGPTDSLSDTFVRDEISYLELEKYKNSLLNKLNSDGSGYITCKTQFDFLLRTDKLSAQECAKNLLADLYKK